MRTRPAGKGEKEGPDSSKGKTKAVKDGPDSSKKKTEKVTLKISMAERIFLLVVCAILVAAAVRARGPRSFRGVCEVSVRLPAPQGQWAALSTPNDNTKTAAPASTPSKATRKR